MDAMMNWLKEFPLWQGEALGVDTLSARPDSVGVFSQGQQVLWEKQTVLGDCAASEGGILSGGRFPDGKRL